MKMSGDDDNPFASIAKLRHISSSQEVLFQEYPLSRQFEAFSDDDSPANNEAPVESTGIVMVSRPDDDNGFTHGERRVDLGKDWDLGLSEGKSIREKGRPSGEFPSKRLKLCEETLGVESPNVSSQKSERVTPCKSLYELQCNIEDVGPSRFNSRKRALPLLENAVGEGDSSSKNPLWNSIRGVLQLLAERRECDPGIENADLLEIAKRGGMTFPWLS